MINTTEEMAALVESQMQTITDPIVYESLHSLLVPPLRQEREWFYGGTDLIFTCWLVMEHKESNTGIAYSDLGFGPSSPWGLVSLSDIFIGSDCEWFQTLERTFYDSFASADLKIWNVVKKVNGEIVEIVEENLTMREAFEKRDKLNSDPAFYTVEYRIISSKE